MTTDMPYMPSVSNIAPILDRIKGAGTPPRFTHDFLKGNLGFASSNDRSIVKILRVLGFLSADGTPTQRYNSFKGMNSGQVLAEGLREGWADLFLSDQRIYEKTASQIQGTVKSITGSGDSVAQKIAITFKALADKADWTVQPTASDNPRAHEQEPAIAQPSGSHDDGTQRAEPQSPVPSPAGSLRLHHDIHLHLPPTSDVSVYRAIFQAMKSELL